jgi:hypothetical protein
MCILYKVCWFVNYSFFFEQKLQLFKMETDEVFCNYINYLD